MFGILAKFFRFSAGKMAINLNCLVKLQHENSSGNRQENILEAPLRHFCKR